jgi:hypothetical protein
MLLAILNGLVIELRDVPIGSFFPELASLDDAAELVLFGLAYENRMVIGASIS